MAPTNFAIRNGNEWPLQSTRLEDRGDALPDADAHGGQPERAPRSIIVWMSVVAIRAPLAPKGWPMAIAPPRTFSFFSSSPACARRRSLARRRPR